MKKIIILTVLGLMIGMVLSSCRKDSKKCTEAKSDTEKAKKSFDKASTEYTFNPSTATYNDMVLSKQKYEQKLDKQDDVCK